MRLVVCGVKARMLEFFLELLRQNPGLTPNAIHWIGQDPESIWVRQVLEEPRLQGIHWIAGEPFEEATLERAHLKKADRALVLIDSSERAPSADEADTRTVMTVLSLKKIRPELHVLAEVVDPDFLPYLEMAQVDEVLWVRETNRMLLAHCSSSTGIAEVFRALCGSREDGGGKLEAIEIPEGFEGGSFASLRSGIESTGRGICIGYIENPGNRRLQKWQALEEAQKSPEVRNVLRNLADAMNLKFNHPVLLPEDATVVPSGARALVLVASGSEAEGAA